MFRRSFVLTLLLLGACQTAQSPAPVPVVAIPSGMAGVTITRGPGYYGGLVSVAVEVNGKKAADLQVGESHVGPVRPGPTVIAISMFGAPGRETHNFTAQAGQRYKFVVGPRDGVMAGTVIGAAVLGPVGALAGGAIGGGSFYPFQIVQTP